MMMVNYFAEWLTDETRLALFPAKSIFRDSYHHKSPTRHEQDLNTHITWVQVLLNKVMQKWYPLRYGATSGWVRWEEKRRKMLCVMIRIWTPPLSLIFRRSQKLTIFLISLKRPDSLSYTTPSLSCTTPRTKKYAILLWAMFFPRPSTRRVESSRCHITV